MNYRDADRFFMPFFMCFNRICLDKWRYNMKYAELNESFFWKHIYNQKKKKKKKKKEKEKRKRKRKETPQMIATITFSC